MNCEQDGKSEKVRRRKKHTHNSVSPFLQSQRLHVFVNCYCSFGVGSFVCSHLNINLENMNVGVTQFIHNSGKSLKFAIILSGNAHVVYGKMVFAGVLLRW